MPTCSSCLPLAFNKSPESHPQTHTLPSCPLLVVLLASAFKEVQEDLVSTPALDLLRSFLIFRSQKRHQSDAELNSRATKVLNSGNTFDEKSWEDIRVGDIVRLESDDFIPADLVLIASSEPEACVISRLRIWMGTCIRDCSALRLNMKPPRRETNLKIKQASPQTSHMTAPHLVTALNGALRCEHPNNSLYTFEGTLELTSSMGVPKQVPLGPIKCCYVVLRFGTPRGCMVWWCTLDTKRN
jgi:phospholipid-transporting ATPase